MPVVYFLIIIFLSKNRTWRLLYSILTKLLGLSFILAKKTIKKPNRVGYCFLNGGSSGNRTSDTRIFSPLLYRLSYEAKKIMAVPTGFEPAIFCVTGRRDRPLHHGTMVAGAGFEPTTFGL